MAWHEHRVESFALQSMSSLWSVDYQSQKCCNLENILFRLQFEDDNYGCIDVENEQMVFNFGYVALYS